MSHPREEVIPVLRVRGAIAIVQWYEQLGFELTYVHRFEPELPAFATIERGEITLFSASTPVMRDPMRSSTSALTGCTLSVRSRAGGLSLKMAEDAVRPGWVSLAAAKLIRLLAEELDKTTSLADRSGRRSFLSLRR
jgi:hypothetical protein